MIQRRHQRQVLVVPLSLNFNSRSVHDNCERTRSPVGFFGSTSFNEPTARNISGVKAGQAGPDSRFARTKHTLISCQFNISSSPSSSLPSSPFFSTALSFFYFSFSFFLSILSHSLFHIIPSILRHFLPLPCIIRLPLPPPSPHLFTLSFILIKCHPRKIWEKWIQRNRIFPRPKTPLPPPPLSPFSRVVRKPVAFYPLLATFFPSPPGDKG